MICCELGSNVRHELALPRYFLRALCVLCGENLSPQNWSLPQDQEVASPNFRT